MICLGEKRNGINVLHIIIGPETEDQFNMNGQSVLDISNYLKDMDPNEQYMLMINRCDCETDVLESLASENAKRQIQNAVSQIIKQNDDGSFSLNSSLENKPKKETTKKDIQCPKCLNPFGGILKDGVVQPCLTCQKIDEAISKKDIPPIQSRDESKKLKDPTKKFFNFRKKKDDGDKPNEIQ